MSVVPKKVDVHDYDFMTRFFCTASVRLGHSGFQFIIDAATEMLQLFWTEDTAVSEVFGAENAVYCKVQDANNVVVSDAFGRCRVIIERVTEDHAGIWKIHIGLPGHVVLQEREVLVHVLAPG